MILLAWSGWLGTCTYDVLLWRSWNWFTIATRWLLVSSSGSVVGVQEKLQGYESGKVYPKAVIKYLGFWFCGFLLPYVSILYCA